MSRLLAGVLGCVAASAAPPARDTPVQLWFCDNPASQTWNLNTTGAESGVVLQGTPYLWDLVGPSNKSGTGVHLFTPYATKSQQFVFKKATGQLESVYAPGKCVAAAAAGAPVIAGISLTIQSCAGSGSLEQSFTYNATSGVIALAADATLCVDAGSSTNCSVAPQSGFPFCNHELPPEARAADLAGRLTVPELAQFLSNQNAGVPRLGVPRLGYGEALHGYVSNCIANPAPGTTGCPTSFPHALLMSGAFNRSLWRAVAGVISTEGRAIFNAVNRTSHVITWAPDINPFRDPRWGRGQEVAGEDPVLIGEYINEYANGLQVGEDPRYVKLVSTAKHFSSYDLENSTDALGVYYIRQNFTAVVTQQDLAQYYWPPFLSAVQRGQCKSIMCSYNSVCVGPACDPAKINATGIPSCADAAFQNGVVRGDWGWSGFIVSDCDAVENVFNTHHYASSSVGAAALSVLGGTDVDCGSTYPQNLVQAVGAGNLTVSDLQLAAQRNLQVAFATGVFDPIGSNVYDSYGPELIDAAAHRALAMDAAVQGIALLANNATGTPWGADLPLLPLRAAALKRVAVIGPNANATLALLSNYEGGNTLVLNHSLLQALTARGSAEGFEVSYAPGCVNSTGGVTTWCQESLGFSAAVAAAQAADVVVLAVGLCSVCPDDGWRLEGEGHDRHDLTLPGQQEALIQAIAATGKPVVVVLIHGGPLAAEWTYANMPTILDAHYPGELGGDAVAAILFGDASPSGRLTTTVYPADFVTLRPMTDMQLAPHGAAPGITHLYYTGPTLWPFGWGLSYTTFSFSWFDAGASSRSVNAAAFASGAAASPAYAVNVTNTGSVTSDVSVLGFFSTGNPGQPVQELFDFERVSALPPGASVTVFLSIPPEVAADAAEDGSLIISPGVSRVWIGEPGNFVRGILELSGTGVAEVAHPWAAR